MPRLRSSLIRQAYHQDPLLLRLLRPCRDLDSARNELRWLREHAINLGRFSHTRSDQDRKQWQHRLRRFCYEREKGKPLQYLLGSQPFGNLDILCRPGVLIPRYGCVEVLSTKILVLMLLVLLQT